MLLRCCLRLLVSYSASAPQLSLFLLTRDIRARVLDLVADVRPLSRRVRYSVERRVPRVLFGLVLGEEREVLPPHVARELRNPLLMPHPEVHGVPPEAKVRMILCVVFLIERFGLDVQFYFRL